MSQYLLLRRLRREAASDDAVTATPTPQPDGEHQASGPNDGYYYDEDYYVYYEDYDTGSAEAPSQEKENAIKELAEKIGDKMHGRCR